MTALLNLQQHAGELIYRKVSDMLYESIGFPDWEISMNSNKLMQKLEGLKQPKVWHYLLFSCNMKIVCMVIE